MAYMTNTHTHTHTLTVSLSTHLLMKIALFHILATLNSAAVKVGCLSFQISKVFSFYGYIPRSRLAGSCGISIFRF